MKPYQARANSIFYSVDLNLNASPPQADKKSKPSGVRLLKKGFVIEVDPYFDEKTLTRVMAVINDA